MLGVKNLLSDIQKGFYIVAEQSHEIIGQLMITYEWSDWKNTTQWWIQSVYVQKKWRKQGLFTNLLQFTRELAVKQNIKILRLYVHADNHNAIQVYNQSGFEKQPYIIYQHTK
ncbi:MAG: GNAT family N-acetyltransferase [Candidatus Thermoplasmatota archaeon]